jgi:general L-amino acid transport system permease protein
MVRPFYVGLLNTLLVASIGIVLSTFLGFFVGVARLSPNWVLSKLAMIYVEVIRNLPLLLQLFFWYNAVLKPLPNPRDSIDLHFCPWGCPRSC